jgi:hypothetical protein
VLWFNSGMNHALQSGLDLRTLSRRFGATFLIAVLGLIGCGGGGDDGPPAQELEDMLGRSCLFDNASEVTCDEPPMPTGGCSGGATACFQLGSSGDAAGPAAICAACCMGSTSHSAAGDCSNLVCSTNDDCPPSYARCMSGICRY